MCVLNGFTTRTEQLFFLILLLRLCVCVSAMLPVLAGRLHGHHEKREQHGVDGA